MTTITTNTKSQSTGKKGDIKNTNSSCVIGTHESSIAKIILRADGILVYQPRKDLVINIEEARLILTYGMSLAKRPSPVLVKMGNIRRVSREARALFASDEYTQLAGQSALLVSSTVSRVIGNFFIGLNKPLYPLRIFEDEDLAIEWLKGFIE